MTEHPYRGTVIVIPDEKPVVGLRSIPILIILVLNWFVVGVLFSNVY
jgi:hypothetical protein